MMLVERGSRLLRYLAIQKLGSGSQCEVWLAKNGANYRAIKVFEQNTDITFELRALENINSKSRHSHLVQFYEAFLDDRSRHCLVFEPLGQSLRDVTRQSQGNRLPFLILKQVVKQLLQALSHLHDQCRLIHTGAGAAKLCVSGRLSLSDLKQSNIMLPLPDDYVFPTESEVPTNEQSPDGPLTLPIAGYTTHFQVKLGDFGACRPADVENTDVAQPLSFRAPEVVLGVPWTTSIDIWNLGMLVLELATGRAFVKPEPYRDSESGLELSEEMTLLAHLTTLFGPLPPALHTGLRSQRFLIADGSLKGISIGETADVEAVIDDRISETETADDAKTFIDMIKSTLALDPAARPTAAQLLQHPFLV